LPLVEKISFTSFWHESMVMHMIPKTAVSDLFMRG
jgi:hypothetical protein